MSYTKRIYLLHIQLKKSAKHPSSDLLKYYSVAYKRKAGYLTSARPQFEAYHSLASKRTE